jgi:DNA-binding response OmpR family regulator
MKKILLVEDDPLVSDIYKTKLEKEGFKVSLARDSESALNKMKEERPDLLLLDIVLPGAEGWEVLEKMRRDEGVKGIKVVIISNLSQKKEIEKGLSLGAIKYLIKANYTPSEVVKEIKKIL